MIKIWIAGLDNGFGSWLEYWILGMDKKGNRWTMSMVNKVNDN